jgi:hypothetical protein
MKLQGVNKDISPKTEGEKRSNQWKKLEYLINGFLD